jgi:hypothetical protein
VKNLDLAPLRDVHCGQARILGATLWRGAPVTTTLLPDLLHHGTAIFLFALGIGMVAVHTVLVTLAAQQSTLGRWRRILVPGFVGAFLTAWLAVALEIGNGTNVPLEREDLRLPVSLLVSLIVGFGPMFMAVALLFASKTMRRINAAMLPAWLIWVQTYRMAGLMFLYPFLYYGVLPAGFAVPAAVGDFLIGASAPLVGLAVARRRSNALAWATAWNVLGLLDLIMAPTAAVLSHAQVIGLYPLNLVPLFIGPPLGILTHIYSLRNLAAVARADVEGARLASAAVGRRTRAVGDGLRTT